MKNGWIMLHRRIMKWAWYRDPNTAHLFLHLVMMAQRRPASFRGIKIQRGQLVTGRKALSEQTGLSEREIRTCHKHLKATNEVTIEATNQYSIITVVNYELYQPSEKSTDQHIDQHIDQQPTSDRPATDHMQQGLRSKEVKKHTPADGFDEFYESYPRKKSRDDALKAWKQKVKDRPPTDVIIAKIEELKKTEDWKKENGQFIPYPASWLRAGGWADEAGPKSFANDDPDTWDQMGEKRNDD